MRAFVLVFFIFGSMVWGAEARVNRVQQYAAYKAHKILPDSLRFFVKKHGKDLFRGLNAGLSAAPSEVSPERIMRETERITAMINSRKNFALVVRQMGYVSGLVAVMTNPSFGGNPAVRQGFGYYMNLKLGRFHFVFDGYESFAGEQSVLNKELARLAGQTKRHRDLLTAGYKANGNNPRYRFSEKSAVFGVCSLYYSNLARLSAHLWYHAWAQAHGDITRTPFTKRQVHPLVSQ